MPRYPLPRLEQDMEILEARSCEEAMQLARFHVDLDLVLLDLALPGTDGLAGLKALRECTPSTPVVVLSAYEERAKVMQALQQGAQGYIPKSSSSEVMLSALRLVLSGALYLPATVLDVAHRPTLYNLDPAFSRLTVRERDVLKLLGSRPIQQGNWQCIGSGRKHRASPRELNTQKT